MLLFKYQESIYKQLLKISKKTVSNKLKGDVHGGKTEVVITLLEAPFN